MLSQENGVLNSNAGTFIGYVHSKGTEVLGFSGPSVLDAPTAPQAVIDLLNTPLTNQTYYKVINP